MADRLPPTRPNYTPPFVNANSGSVTAGATFVKVDASTQGTWKGVYGSEGGIINGDATNFPAYAQVNLSVQGPVVWSASTADARGLQKFAAQDRIASGWYSFTNMTIDG